MKLGVMGRCQARPAATPSFLSSSSLPFYSPPLPPQEGNEMGAEGTGAVAAVLRKMTNLKDLRLVRSVCWGCG